MLSVHYHRCCWSAFSTFFAASYLSRTDADLCHQRTELSSSAYANKSSDTVFLFFFLLFLSVTFGIFWKHFSFLLFRLVICSLLYVLPLSNHMMPMKNYTKLTDSIKDEINLSSCQFQRRSLPMSSNDWTKKIHFIYIASNDNVGC